MHLQVSTIPRGLVDGVFHLRPPAKEGRGRLLRRLYARSIPSLERFLGLDRINAVYAHGAGQESSQGFIEKCLEYLDIHCRVSAEDLARVPKTGPVVVVSNHPFGAIDGLMLAWVLRQVRPDVRIMANHLLHRIPQL